MNNRMRGECTNCKQMYCMECSEHEHWQEFCSERCYDEYVSEKEYTVVWSRPTEGFNCWSEEL